MGFKTAQLARRHRPDRDAGVGERDARGRPTGGDGRRDGRHRDRADAERDGGHDDPVKQIQQLPVITHTALDYVVSLPGVETAGSNTRGSTINGLPTTAINITLDGINVQDKRGSEGFFMYIRPMMDSVEEITVSTSTPGAEASGGGAAEIRMETRAGSNRFSGSVYNTWRNQAGTNEDDAIARTKKPGWLWG